MAVEGREALVGNLFGSKKMLAAEAVVAAGKKRKSKEARKTFGEEDDSDISLI